MLTDLVNKLRILPRWVIIILDSTILCVSTFIGFSLRFNFDFAEANQFNIIEGIAIFMVMGIFASLVTRSYAGVVRYTGVADGIRIMYASVLTLGGVCLLNLVYYYNHSKNLIPYSVAFISFFVSFLLLFYYRLIVKSLFQYYKSEQNRYINVAIFGAGQLGIMAKQAIENDSHSKFKLIAFIEDDVKKRGTVINGTTVYSGLHLVRLFKELAIRELIIAVRDLSPERKNEIIEIAFQNHIKVRYVPPIDRWVKSELKLGQIREVNIEDLLGRDVIHLDQNVVDEVAHKRVLVTGAAGSIGSELARQIAEVQPGQLVLLDQAETPLYEIELEVRKNYPLLNLRVIVCDITNRERVRNVYAEFRPEIIFHAAAYKHVPLMEENPSEAVQCNVFGTKTLADLAVEFKVSKFVMISTDKAVNPSSVMGCSKRIAEIYVQSLHNSLKYEKANCAFVTTRFGNVLGSNGSVIPIFKRQIEQGGPVTVTHPEVTRYFMTIAEACRLVLEAGVMGHGGEIYIFDMGNPIRIQDLARKMIALSGFEVDKDIEIAYTGLRQGEKLYEELLNKREDSIPTHHEKIVKAKVAEYDYNLISNMLDILKEIVNDKNDLKVVAMMKELVPEYKSNISKFETLDN